MIYEGFDVLDWVTPIDSINLTVQNKYNIIGDIYQQREMNIQYGNYSLLRYKFAFDNRNQRWEFAEFFKKCKGKHVRFFIPSFKNDFKLLKTVPQGEYELVCKKSYEVRAFTEHLQFIYLEGEPQLFKILEVTEGFDDVLGEAITIVRVNASFSRDLEPGCTILQNCYFGRWNTDTLTFDLDDITNSTATLDFREASKEEIEETFQWE
jgi:hypothetical protein